jgi:signal transduction histidine kinase
VRLRIEEARAIGVSAPADEQLEAATREVDRMARIVQQLLVLSRAGEHELPAETLDLRDVVERAVERWTPVAQAAGLQVRVDTAGSAPSAWAPGADVDRALDALVENALRYAPPGTVVEVAAQGAGIDVRDRGPGIDPDEVDVVWDRFHRGAAGRARPGGTGLGLPIARELARGWGGDAALAARPGGGTIAHLSLPAAARERTTHEAEAIA